MSRTSKWEELELKHLGHGSDDVAVIDQANEAIRRVVLLVDDKKYADKGDVTVKITAKKVYEKEKGEITGEELVIEAAVTEKKPARLNSPLELSCDHKNEKVMVKAEQLHLFEVELKRPEGAS